MIWILVAGSLLALGWGRSEVDDGPRDVRAGHGRCAGHRRITRGSLPDAMAGDGRVDAGHFLLDDAAEAVARSVP